MGRLAQKELKLSDCERLELQQLINRHNTPQQIDVGRLLEEAKLKPHKSRYWLTPPSQGLSSVCF